MFRKTRFFQSARRRDSETQSLSCSSCSASYREPGPSLWILIAFRAIFSDPQNPGEFLEDAKRTKSANNEKWLNRKWSTIEFANWFRKCPLKRFSDCFEVESFQPSNRSDLLISSNEFSSHKFSGTLANFETGSVRSDSELLKTVQRFQKFQLEKINMLLIDTQRLSRMSITHTASAQAACHHLLAGCAKFSAF